MKEQLPTQLAEFFKIPILIERNLNIWRAIRTIGEFDYENNTMNTSLYLAYPLSDCQFEVSVESQDKLYINPFKGSR
ncbi:hypothetical protein [Scytonema sp. NUACC26]|uniref:hypothetical protein n=1 Tax=Scytonema sp. NUACC26 TaxID=3140176 RepID=UPI0038B3AA46